MTFRAFGARCCLEDTFSFSLNGQCHRCLVFGWDPRGVSGIPGETLDAYVGYKKGVPGLEVTLKLNYNRVYLEHIS